VPIYEFVCEACGRLAEVMQKVTDPAPASCPECGEGRMARTVSRTSFQLKGGGWYSDLYASKKEKPAPGQKPGTGGEATGGEAKGGAAAGSEKPATASPQASAPAAPSAPPAAGGGTTKGT
jgi:putative FmdB family regulatory protein